MVMHKGFWRKLENFKHVIKSFSRIVTISSGTTIGAGSIVTHDCDNNSFYAGNPARKIKPLD